MNYQKPIAMLVVMAMLSGCASRIESGQLDYDNGIAYKHGSNDPFSGKVHFENGWNFLRGSNGAIAAFNPDNVKYASVGSNFSCTASFKGGVPEGDIGCVYDNGNKAVSLFLQNGRIDGEAVRYNEDGNKVFVTHWKKGSADGDQRVYSADGRNIIHEWNVYNGHKRGKEVRRYGNGSDLTEGAWDDDGKYTGTFLALNEGAIYTVKDGVLNGAFKKFDMDARPNLTKVIVEGGYRDGNKDGLWVYHGRSVIEFESPYAEDSPILRVLLGLNHVDIVDVNMANGVVAGLNRVYDKDGHILLSFNVENDKIIPPVKRFDPGSGASIVFKDDATIDALNYEGMVDLKNPAGNWNAVMAANAARIKYVLDPVHAPKPSPQPDTSRGDASQ